MMDLVQLECMTIVCLPLFLIGDWVADRDSFGKYASGRTSHDRRGRIYRYIQAFSE